ncbi:TRAP transporter substrate-binding protein DctP [Pelobacter seleniigenes]|uniref:TRAP transporter substrate-binding protein DctP n=1 Tax=Pelobacter seleniigenes TaxID=407188 RepID=UPI000B2383EB|nr:TRAP transporter substrate-binding protein DctP [Pelobacter seleniigenes]
MRNLVAILLMSMVAFLSTNAAAADYKLDIALESAPTHVRSKAMVKFAEELRKRSKGAIEVNVYSSGSKYSGATVPIALAQGAIDMGAPLHQHLTKVIPEANVPLLPMFYGVDAETIRKLWDGPAGKKLNQLIESKLQVKVIGGYFDLGFGSVFTTSKKIMVPEDMVGLKMRVPGGAATTQRYKALGATPVIISWGDVPQALQRGTVDGIWSTQESVRSSKLFDSGIKYGFEDRQAFLQYVPMISKKAWNSYSSEIQQLIEETWNDLVADARKTALDIQFEARRVNAENGIETVDPDPVVLKATREKLMMGQPALVKELGINPDFIELVLSELTKLSN